MHFRRRRKPIAADVKAVYALKQRLNQKQLRVTKHIFACNLPIRRADGQKVIIAFFLSLFSLLFRSTKTDTNINVDINADTDTGRDTKRNREIDTDTDTEADTDVERDTNIKRFPERLGTSQDVS